MGLKSALYRGGGALFEKKLADCSSVKLEGFSASAPWCQHLLEDFVEGRSFAIPEPARLPLRPLAKML